MSTVTKPRRRRPSMPAVIGPKWHGRRISDQDAFSSRYESGYKYEIIDGRLYVSPQANPPENCLDEWLRDHLKDYSRRRPDVINYVTGKARVVLPRRRFTTCPEPDV